MLRNFLRGLIIPFSAARLIIRHRALWLWSVLPVALTIVVWVLVWRAWFIPLHNSAADVVTAAISRLVGNDFLSGYQGVVHVV
jgi:hypothetical protein